MLRLGFGFTSTAVIGALIAICGVSGAFPATHEVVSPAPAVRASLRAPDSAPHHLPDWVQTRVSAPLWSGPDNQAIQFTQLPAWTFLKVIGASGDRLEVEFDGYSDAGQPGPGWVSVPDVEPSDPGGAWLRNHRPSVLFAGPTGLARLASVPQWSWMVRLDDDVSSTGQLHVRVYDVSLVSVVGEGWLSAGDVGPTGPPSQSVWTGQDQAPPPAFTSHDQFVAAVADAARATSANAPVSVTVAQAILESNWGQSLLSREANNYFGIKATGQLGNDGAVWMPTLEVGKAGTYRAFAAFRAYRSLADSVADHGRLFRDVGLYRQALQVVSEPDEFARRIAQAGYSTDPNYAAKLMDLMRRGDLYRLDAPAEPIPQTA